jgi:hypothetical protein
LGGSRNWAGYLYSIAAILSACKLLMTAGVIMSWQQSTIADLPLKLRIEHHIQIAVM